MLGTTNLLLLLAFVFIRSSPLGKEVKQERKLRARKKKQNNEKERGGGKEKEIRKIK